MRTKPAEWGHTHREGCVNELHQRARATEQHADGRGYSQCRQPRWPPTLCRRSPRTSRRSSRPSASRATSRARLRRCRSSPIKDARPWARSIKSRVATRQMPPWHIDRSVGVQKFKNDMSLTDEQVDDDRRAGSIRARRRATRPTSRPSRSPRRCSGRASATATARPTSSSSRPMQTMPAVHQDQWWRPMIDIPLTEPRWVRWSKSVRPTSRAARSCITRSPITC